ncbi:MAG: hypothetical protein WCC99_01375 [Candidatus Sulfotelmatobacter sp.]
MRWSRSTTLLPFLIVFASVPFYGQAGGSAQTQSSSSAPSSKPATDGDAKPVLAPIPPDAPRMAKQTRYEIIRDFETQLVYARTAFPMGTKGLQLKQGVVTPNGEELQQALNLWGPAVKPGDPAHISFVQIKNDHIHFELNGGPIRRQKWYQRVEISGANGPLNTGPNEPQSNPHGSYLDVYFDKYVPEMTAAQLRGLLYPALDFNARNKEQAYLDTVPPKVKAAIQAHHVLVGMNQEMVLHAKGKPPKKVRERAGETDYEEWIYGEAPADVDFVRFVGDEVVRVETMKVDGEKIVRTDREVVLQPDKDKEAKKEKEPDQRPATAPSLRRPGEDQQDVPKPANGATPPPMMPPPDLPQPPSGPNEIMASR